MAIYKRPSKKVHRGFVYLNDETVINSLSAVESGKIDEVVAKVNSAREGGFGGGVGIQGAKVEGAKKSTSGFEEEMVRTRTRFSVFDLWYRSLVEAKAIGQFDGWGADALMGVEVGDTVEFRAGLEVAPLQVLFRSFLWFADKAAATGNVFSQNGAELKETKAAAQNIRMMMGDANDEDEEVIVLATPDGDPGPVIAMPLRLKWLIGSLGQFGGKYSVIAQVERIVPGDEEFAALRLIRDVPPTPMEITTLREATANFNEPGQALGVTLPDDVVTIAGPALWLEPIAIFR